MKRITRTCLFLIVAFALLSCTTSHDKPTIDIEWEVAKALAQTAEAFTSTPLPTETMPTTNTPVPTRTIAVTNTPKPTKIPVPTATITRGSFNSPFPFAEEIDLVNSSSDKKSEWSLQVLNVIRGDEANYIINDANQFNDDPPVNTSWMLIKVKVTLKNGNALTLDASDLSVISNGLLYAGSTFGVCCTENNGYPELDANIAVPGTSVEGWVIRPVGIDDKAPLMALNITKYSPDMTKGLFFALSK
ncbi:MAG: hypothetical protein LLG44_14360 [Chloroflexi bacterium]|nr:hypothetical protein [Chloroflexota bacterium]